MAKFKICLRKTLKWGEMKNEKYKKSLTMQQRQ